MHTILLIYSIRLFPRQSNTSAIPPLLFSKFSSGFSFNFDSIHLPIVIFNMCACVCVLLGRDFLFSSTNMLFSKSSATNPFSYGSQTILNEISFPWPTVFGRVIVYDGCHTLRVRRGSRTSAHTISVWSERRGHDDTLSTRVGRRQTGSWRNDGSDPHAVHGRVFVW